MIDLLIYDRDRAEQNLLIGKARDMTALLSDEKLGCSSYETMDAVDRHISNDSPYDLSMLEITGDEDVALSGRVRAGREQAEIMLMADGRLSPMKYLTPTIRACSLLLRPYDDDTMHAVVQEFMTAFFRRRETPSDENSIIIENRSGTTVLQYSSIYYIEARDKKVIFRVRDREYSKYDTLDNIRRQLPSYFVQSHRSYIFNAGYLDRIKLSDNTVYLEHNITIPLSRSYKASVREYLNGLSGNGINNNQG